MSYKALLFVPDQATARQVTEVLSDLDFTVEILLDPFATVKKLSDELFDALVVDCADEQNATLLFKAARNSSLNHSSLCVAVAEDQAGVAKAFRIGANLVLTKPINIEQSKGTLRVARGLLRKNEPKTVGTTGAWAPTSDSHTAPAIEPGGTAADTNLPPPGLSKAFVPSSLLEAEQEKAAGDQDSERSLEAVPHSGATKSSFLESVGPSSKSYSELSAASGSSAAAPALAPEKADPEAVKSAPKWAPKIRSTRPLAPHDPITPELPVRETSPFYSPTSYAPRPSDSTESGKKLVWLVICLMIFAAGYLGWQKFQPLKYLHQAAPTRSEETTSAAEPASPADQKPSPTITLPPAEPQNTTLNPIHGAAANNSPTSAAAPMTDAAPEGFPTKENIEVAGADAEPASNVAGANPDPLPATNEPDASPAAAQPPPPPALVLPGSPNSGSALSGIISPKAVLPKPAPGTLRLSQGVTQGLLVSRVSPAYPSTALAMRKEGTVELMATISKTGAITAVKVLSGDPALAKAAVDAVRQWKYRPYLLNSEPVEIETQVTVVFKLPK
jgi:periplasmic protein TonB